jgi:hypothetical protein
MTNQTKWASDENVGKIQRRGRSVKEPARCRRYQGKKDSFRKDVKEEEGVIPRKTRNEEEAFRKGREREREGFFFSRTPPACSSYGRRAQQARNDK